MSAKVATQTTGNVLRKLSETFTFVSDKWASPLSDAVNSGGVRIKNYTPVLASANAWLSAVEQRIRNSIRPGGSDDEESTEWLNSYAAGAAINFFQNVADLLPTEPHLSATLSGDLVAEFEAPACNMTSIISDSNTILFGVPANYPDKSVQVVIRRGSNRLREETKEFTRKLHSVSDESKTVASR